MSRLREGHKGPWIRVSIIAAMVAVLMLHLFTVEVIAPDPLQNFSVVATSRRYETGSNESGTPIPAFAGNVTELSIYQEQVTQTWQGYYGNVDGEVVLDDALNQSLYAWQLVNPTGEIFAVRNSTAINWTGGNIVCAEEPHTVREEAEMFINFLTSQAVDGVNETFDTLTHPGFNVSSNGFEPDVCNYTTALFVNDTDPAGGLVPLSFNETLLWSSSDAALIFMAYINPNNDGFNSSTGGGESQYDFEMIVTEDGHNDDLAVTTYYFYIELDV